MKKGGGGRWQNRRRDEEIRAGTELQWLAKLHKRRAFWVQIYQPAGAFWAKKKKKKHAKDEQWEKKDEWQESSRSGDTSRKSDMFTNT